MTARRGRRRHVGLFVVALLLLVAEGCRMGNNPARSPTARSPRGIRVSVTWFVPGGTIPRTQGEMLGVGDTGVYLLQDGRVVLYSFDEPVLLSPYEHPPEDFDLRWEHDLRLDELAQYARYPFGMDDDLLGRLLNGLGEDSVVVAPYPRRALGR